MGDGGYPPEMRTEIRNMCGNQSPDSPAAVFTSTGTAGQHNEENKRFHQNINFIYPFRHGGGYQSMILI